MTIQHVHLSLYGLHLHPEADLVTCRCQLIGLLLLLRLRAGGFAHSARLAASRTVPPPEWFVGTLPFPRLQIDPFLALSAFPSVRDFFDERAVSREQAAHRRRRVWYARRINSPVGVPLRLKSGQLVNLQTVDGTNGCMRTQAD